MRGKGTPLFTEIPRNIHSVVFQMYSNHPVDIPKRIVIPERPDMIDTAIITVDAMPPVRPNRLIHRCERPEMQKTCSSNYRPSPQSVVQDRFGEIIWLWGLHWTKLWAIRFTGLVAKTLFGVCWSPRRVTFKVGLGSWPVWWLAWIFRLESYKLCVSRAERLEWADELYLIDLTPLSSRFAK